jgi:hypothetical protein
LRSEAADDVIWALHLVKGQCDAGCTLADTPPDRHPSLE